MQVPCEVDDRDETKDAAAVVEVEQAIPKYHTRAQMSEFMAKYKAVTNVGPAMLRNMYRTLTDDAGASQDANNRAVDERIIEFIASGMDIELWPDLRVVNGNRGDK